MRRVAFLIHGIGFKQKDETKGLGRYREILEAHGWSVVWLPLGRYFLLRVFLVNRIVASILAAVCGLLKEVFGAVVVMIAHSNGAAIAVEASRRGAPLDALVSISGAMRRNPELGPETAFVLNYYTGTDWIVRIARLASPVLDHDWGDAGAKRLSGSLEIPHTDVPLSNWKVYRHGDAFRPHVAEQIAVHLVRQLDDVLVLFAGGAVTEAENNA